MVVQKIDCDDDQAWLVLKEHMWATMTWPLRRLDFDNFEMDAEGHATWLHVYNPHEFHVLPTIPTWNESHGLTLCQTGEPEPLIKYTLQHKPSALVYNSLLILGRYLGVLDGSGKPSRKLLLQRLAESQGGPDYVSDVLAADNKKPQQGLSEEMQNLIDCLYENLDLDERTEYRDLKKKSDQSSKTKKQQKWQNWLKQKEDAKKASHCFLSPCHAN